MSGSGSYAATISHGESNTTTSYGYFHETTESTGGTEGTTYTAGSAWTAAANGSRSAWGWYSEHGLGSFVSTSGRMTVYSGGGEGSGSYVSSVGGLNTSSKNTYAWTTGATHVTDPYVPSGST